MYTDKAAINPVITIERSQGPHVVSSATSYANPVFYRGSSIPTILIVSPYGLTKMKPEKIIKYYDGTSEAIVDGMLFAAVDGGRVYARVK